MFQLEKYCREFHSQKNVYQIEIDIHSSYTVLKLPDETLTSDNFKYFAEHSKFIKQYESGIVYKWLVRVLQSVELETKCLDDWTDFPK